MRHSAWEGLDIMDHWRRYLATPDAYLALVFEPSAGGAVKMARKGVGLFQITATGDEAHAGLDPDAGASAIEEIARVVLALHSPTDADAGTTMNVGLLAGGTRSNVIAGRAEAHVDVRVPSAAEVARIDQALAGLTPHDPRATLAVNGGWNCPVMERTAAVAALFEQARERAAELDIDLRECCGGCASDGNFVSALGVPVLDGVGAVGAGAHVRHENASVTGMLERTALAAAVLHALAARPGTAGRLGRL